MDKIMEQYEIGYLLKSTLKEEEISVFSKKLSDNITKEKGVVTSEGKAKKQPLAYPIKKENDAIFNWIRFSLNTSLIKEIKDMLDADSAVLRFLIIKVKKEKQKKTPILKLFTPTQETILNKKQTTTTIKKESVKEEEIDKKIEEIFGEKTEQETTKYSL